MAMSVAGLAACGAEDGTGGAGGAPSVDGRTFVATSASDGSGPRVLSGRIALDFTKRGEVRVSTGCNSGNGTGGIRDGRLVLDDVATTLIGCPEPVASQEEFVLLLVQARPAATLTADELVLRTDTNELRLVDSRVAEPALPLEGTRWTIEGTFDGQTASSAGRSGFLVFQGGRVSGETACSPFEGEAKISGSTVTFGGLATPTAACADPAGGVEAAVAHVLQGTVQAQISSSSLRLTAGDGTGIMLRGR
jgi:heat shock protein HslJ